MSEAPRQYNKSDGTPFNLSVPSNAINLQKACTEDPKKIADRCFNSEQSVKIWL
jgi:hypothetical protein